MKQLVKNYSFNAASKTVTLTDFGTILLERLELIIDTTTNTILYNFADSTVATATVATNIVTLSTVSGAQSTDKLMIIYDAQTGDPTYDTPVLPNNAAKETGGSLASISTVQGGTADAAVTGDNAGTISAKMRGLTKILADIWDSVNHRIKVDGSGVTQPVTQTTPANLTTAIYGYDGTNPQKIKTKSDGTLVPGTTASSAITSVASSATSVQLLAANTNRTGAYFYNDSNYPLYIAFAGSASISAYTVQVPSQGLYEMPTVPVYTGAIFGIWSTANGNVRITELS